MGDRANVAFKGTRYQKVSGRQFGKEVADKPIYFYTHWAGTDLPKTVQRALQRRQRWTDSSYLARIIFSEMIGGGECAPNMLGETGYGIGLQIGDGEDRIVTVDCHRQIVRFKGYDLPEISFDGFCSLQL